MPARLTEWTAEMALALPDDGNRYEVLDGVLAITAVPSLEHQKVLLELYRRLSPYVEANDLGWTMLSPADLEFGPQLLLQPDLFVVPDTGSGEPESWKDVTSLLLAVEVTSPTTGGIDRGPKRVVYGRHVPEYWIVDDDRRAVERWRPGDERPEILDSLLQWQPDPNIPPLRIDVVDLLR